MFIPEFVELSFLILLNYSMEAHLICSSGARFIKNIPGGIAWTGSVWQTLVEITDEKPDGRYEFGRIWSIIKKMRLCPSGPCYCRPVPAADRSSA